MGFPTANLEGIDTQIPADGVYAARALREGNAAPLAAAVHIGPNVTFGAQARTVEAHLIDFAGDLYDQSLELDLFERLRPSRRFASADELCDQMRRDVAQARSCLSRNHNIP